jgi:putative acetyltransferase
VSIRHSRILGTMKTSMDFRKIGRDRSREVTDLFRACFTASEGADEGEGIAALAQALAGNVDEDSVFCFGAFEGEAIVGAIFFTRLVYEAPLRAYMLSPVAVETSRQGNGIGKSLIAFGLDVMRARAAQVAVTYGDPDFYQKLGFLALSEDRLKAPMKLSMPFGWLGQSLTEATIPFLGDRPACVEAFNDPKYW